MDTSQKEGVIGIDIADTGETILIMKQTFDGATGELELAIEIGRSELGRKKIGTENGLELFDLGGS